MTEMERPRHRKSLDWKIEHPKPQRGALTWDSKRRAWVDARTGEVVGKVAA